LPRHRRLRRRQPLLAADLAQFDADRPQVAAHELPRLMRLALELQARTQQRTHFLGPRRADMHPSVQTRRQGFADQPGVALVGLDLAVGPERPLTARLHHRHAQAALLKLARQP
jgi:hypothetical protein